MQSQYKPHFLLPFGIQQMIAINLAKFPDAENLTFDVEDINNEGLHLWWASFKNQKLNLNSKSPVLLFLPGMTGNVEDPYVQNIIIEGLKNGFNVVMFQMRILNEKFLLPKKGIFRWYDDIDLCLDKIKEKYPQSKIYAIGGSYGANNLVYYLGYKNNKNKKIECAVSISNPYDMRLCERMCEDTIFSSLVVYLERDNFKKIKKGVEKTSIYNPYNLNAEDVSICEDMKGYDELFTRKILGYKSADDYYINISAYNMIDKVNIPLLCLNSIDDGLTSNKAIPYDHIRLNENIFLLVTDKGAHMCYISNEKFTEFKQWDMKPIFEFLNAYRKISENI
jgi:abhydrolase domain-containing protein 1/3